MTEFYSTTEEDTTEILASGHGSEQREPIVIASGVGVLVKGTVLGQYSSGANSGMYGAYSNADVDSVGLGVARGIITDKANASSSGVRASMYRHGAFIEDNLTGLDATAKTDLNNCTFVSRV